LHRLGGRLVSRACELYPSLIFKSQATPVLFLERATRSGHTGYVAILDTVAIASSDRLTGSYSESEGPLVHSGLISPDKSRNRTSPVLELHMYDKCVYQELRCATSPRTRKKLYVK
jgi:hypothetical protein